MSAASQMLEIPEVRARVSPVAVAQYHQFPEFNEHGRRTELIRGIVIEKMSKSPLAFDVRPAVVQVWSDGATCAGHLAGPSSFFSDECPSAKHRFADPGGVGRHWASRG